MDLKDEIRKLLSEEELDEAVDGILERWLREMVPDNVDRKKIRTAYKAIDAPPGLKMNLVKIVWEIGWNEGGIDAQTSWHS